MSILKNIVEEAIDIQLMDVYNISNMILDYNTFTTYSPENIKEWKRATLYPQYTDKGDVFVFLLLNNSSFLIINYKTDEYIIDDGKTSIIDASFKAQERTNFDCLYRPKTTSKYLYLAQVCFFPTKKQDFRANVKGFYEKLLTTLNDPVNNIIDTVSLELSSIKRSIMDVNIVNRRRHELSLHITDIINSI